MSFKPAQSQSPTFVQQQQSIAGHLQLKRKRFWVIRYATVLNGVFFYFQNQGDLQPRFALKLSECSIKKLTINGGAKVIRLSTLKSIIHEATDILLMPQDNDFKQWYEILSLFCGQQQPKKINQEALIQSPHASQIEGQQFEQKLINQISSASPSAQFKTNIASSNDNYEIFPSIQAQVNTNVNSNNNQQQQQQPQQQQQQQSLTMQAVAQLPNNEILPITSTSQLDPQFLEPNISIEAQLRLKVNLHQILGEFNKKNFVLCDIKQNMKVFCQRLTWASQAAQSAQQQKKIQEEESNKSLFEKAQDKITRTTKSIIDTIGISIFISVAATIFALLITIIYLLMHLFNTYLLVLSTIFATYILLIPFLPREIRQQIQDNYIKKKSRSLTKFRVKAAMFFPFSANDFLWALKQFKYRYLWQPFVSVVQEDKENITLTLNQLKKKGESQERFMQTILKENKTVYIIEHSNFNIQRIFMFTIENSSNNLQLDLDLEGELGILNQGGGLGNGFYLEYYSRTDACLLSEMRTHNSPNLIFGLLEYLTEVKNNPKSQIFVYYRKRLEDQQQESLKQKQRSGGSFKQFDDISLSSIASQNNNNITNVNQNKISSQPQQKGLQPDINLGIPIHKGSEDNTLIKKRNFKSEVIEPDDEDINQIVPNKNDNIKKKMKSVQDAAFLRPNEIKQKNETQPQIQQQNQSSPSVDNQVLQQQQQQQQSQQEQEIEESKDQNIASEFQMYMDLADKAVDELQQDAQITPQSGWTLQTNKDNFQLHTKEDSVTGDSYSRGETLFPCPILDIVKYIVDLPNRGIYDDLFDCGEIIENITENIKIVRQQFKGMKFIGVAPRDFVMVIGVIEKYGRTYIVAKGCQYDKAPPVKDVVRGDMKIGGWILERVNEQTSRGIYMVASNAKGKLPMAAKNHAAEKQGFSVKNLRKLIEKSKGIK